MKKAYEFFAGGYFHSIKTGTNFKYDNSLYRFKVRLSDDTPTGNTAY